MDDAPVFRKVALERLSSPEQLDQLIAVTTTQAWIALASCGALIITAVLWGILGSVQTRVSAQGMLLGGEMFDVTPIFPGQITRFNVSPGDRVRVGDVLAEVAQPEIVQQLASARARLGELRLDATQLGAFGSQSAQLQDEVVRRQRANLEAQIEAAERRRVFLERQLKGDEELLARGLVTRQQLQATQLEYEGARQQVERGRTELKELSARELGTRFDVERQRRAGVQRVGEAERLVAQLQSDLTTHSRVVATANGHVLARLADLGDLVAPGQPIAKLSLDQTDVRQLRAVLYLSTADGKKVRSGMEIQVAPSTVKPEEYGYIVGRVTRVGGFPATTQELMHVLKNDQLARQLSAAGAPFEVVAELLPKPQSTTGYQWTSSGGPPLTIESGTPALGRIITEARPPIELVLPALRRWLGA